jgi:hypothetical protein
MSQTETKSAIYTTEFYLTILTNVSIIAAIFLGKLDPQLGFGFLTGGNALYGIARGIAKQGIKPE